MSVPIGLERIPPGIAALLDEAWSNLAQGASDLDDVAHAPIAAAAELEHREVVARRIRDHLFARLTVSRRGGPDRVELLALVEAAGDVLEELRVVAWTWSRCPLDDAAEPVSALRDCARACASALAALDESPALLRHIERCEEREEELRSSVRRARAALLVRRNDARVGLCADRLLGRVEDGLRRSVALRVQLQRHAVT